MVVERFPRLFFVVVVVGPFLFCLFFYFFLGDVGVDDKLRHICHDGAGTAQLPCPATCGSIATRVRHNCHEDAKSNGLMPRSSA